jgi:7,8-dihydroneopterin aldolase/epimerase/oxygenase
MTTELPRVLVLRFDSACFPVRLGVSDEERAEPQEVSLAVALRFGEPVKACLSDRLEDTVCYASLIESAERFCARKPYHLLEALCHDLFLHIRREIGPSTSLWIMLTKLAPPVPALRGGVSFAIGDWAP